MSLLNVISLLAGLAFFLYGITLMGDGLNLAAGNRLESVLFRLTNFERVGDHCSNVAAALIEIRQDLFDAHEYVDSLKLIKDEAFGQNYERFRAKY